MRNANADSGMPHVGVRVASCSVYKSVQNYCLDLEKCIFLPGFPFPGIVLGGYGLCGRFLGKVSSVGQVFLVEWSPSLLLYPHNPLLDSWETFSTKFPRHTHQRLSHCAMPTFWLLVWWTLDGLLSGFWSCGRLASGHLSSRLAKNEKARN